MSFGHRKGGGPAGGDQSDPTLDALRTQLGDVSETLSPIAKMLLERGTGAGTDPLIEAQRGRTLEGERGALATRGVTGSAVENQLARTSAGFDEASLAGRDKSLQAGVGLTQGLVQNTAGLSALETGRLAAMKSGQGGGGKGGK